MRSQQESKEGLTLWYYASWFDLFSVLGRDFKYHKHGCQWNIVEQHNNSQQWIQSWKPCSRHTIFLNPLLNPSVWPFSLQHTLDSKTIRNGDGQMLPPWKVFTTMFMEPSWTPFIPSWDPYFHWGTPISSYFLFSFSPYIFIDTVTWSTLSIQKWKTLIPSNSFLFPLAIHPP